MAWGTKKEETPDELKEFNMTPAQIRDALKAKKDLEDKVAAQSTELSTVKTSLGTLEGTFNQTKAKLDELEANTRRQPDKNREEKTYTSFIDDENKAFAERAVDAMQPIAVVAMQSAANSAMLLAKQSLSGQYVETAGGKISLSRLWEKWSGEIDKNAQQTNLASRGTMEFWLNVFDYVKGKHFNELMSQPQTFVESVSTNQDHGPSGEVKKDEKLNDAELDVIKKMSRYGKGVTPESYKKTKEGMTFVNV